MPKGGENTKRSEIIALLFLSHQNLDHLKSLEDYIEQFDVVEKQVQGIMDVLETKASSD